MCVMAADRSVAHTASRAAGPGFRDDIQGMRALAVLAIMAFHAGFSPYPGGFVTLDVFFVISGFLITALLLREIDRTGTLSLRRFYERRARRILPAATAATVGILIASWTWLSLVEADDAAADARWATLFAANIRFALEETDYFAADQPPSPFQHYWSLSVEEQFYAVLPLVLLACVLLATRVTGRSGRGPDPRRVIAAGLVAITLASFAWSVHASATSPETAYFSTFTRTWEFGVGALLAIAAPRLGRDLTARARNLLAVLGLTAIAVACFVVTEATPFPGYAALLPVLGAGAVMVAGAELGTRPTPLLQRALGVGPLRRIGDMSYSLYLWHWPVLVIATGHLGRDLTVRETALAFGAIFAVSWASYRFVEMPFRRGMPPRLGRGLVLYPLALTVVAVSAGEVSTVVRHELDRPNPAISLADYPAAPREGEQRAKDDQRAKGDQRASSGAPTGAAERSSIGPRAAMERRRERRATAPPDPAVAIVQASARAAEQDAPVPGDLQPPLDEIADDKAELECDYGSGDRELCPRGDPGGDQTLVVLGDSHGRHWIPALDEVAEDAGYTAYYLVRPACTAARVVPYDRRYDARDQECVDFNEWTARQVAALEPDLLIVSSTGARSVEVGDEVYSDQDDVAPELRAGFDELIADLSPHADRVVVLGDVPRREEAPDQCLSERGATLGSCDNTEAAWPARIRRLTRDAARAGGADFVATRQWFCDGGTCPPVIGATIPMRDPGHITTEYAAELAAPLADALDLTP